MDIWGVLKGLKTYLLLGWEGSYFVVRVLDLKLQLKRRGFFLGFGRRILEGFGIKRVEKEEIKRRISGHWTRGTVRVFFFFFVLGRGFLLGRRDTVRVLMSYFEN